MSKGKLISPTQFSAFTRLPIKTVDQDIERGIIKTETNTKGKQSIRWFSIPKNLGSYQKAKAKWETEEQYSASRENKTRKKYQTKAVKIGDPIAVSKWAKLLGLKTPTLLTNAIKDDNLFEFVKIKIESKSVPGSQRRHFKIEWVTQEKADIIIDVLYMKRTPLDWKKKYLAEKLNPPEEPEEPEIEEPEEPEEPEEIEEVKEPEEVKNPMADLIEILAQCAWGITKRYLELKEEHANEKAENVGCETEGDTLQSHGAAN